MIREAVRDYLAATDAQVLALLTGGLYPTNAEPVTRVSTSDTPAAFDGFRRLRPVGLWTESNIVPLGPTRDSASAFLQLYVWQERGRDVIDAVLLRTYRALTAARVTVTLGWLYELRWVGDGSARDALLNDAELGWSRWQAILKRT